MKQGKKKEYLLKAIIIAGAFFLGTSIGIFGTYQYTKGKVKNSHMAEENEADKLVTDKIAIVNLDVGVMVNEEKVNYAGKLFTDLADNFLFTGLEDARHGYASGIYAGYLIIPATFSESVVSLNDTPIRAEIEYAINDELKESVKEKVIYDVLGLISEANNRVSYMYLYSVMDEFHDAQDKADTVMENDIEEKDAINAVQANDLIALVPVVEFTEIEYNIEPVDISEYMAKNVELTSQVGMKYNEYLMESETDHLKLNEEAIGLMEEMGNMDEIISSIDLVHDGNGNEVFQEGVEELGVLFDEHNAYLSEKSVEIHGNVLEIYSDIQTYLYEYDRAKAFYEKENEEKYLNTLNALEMLFQEYRDNYVLMPRSEVQRIQDIVEERNLEIAQYKENLDEMDEESGESLLPPFSFDEGCIVELSELQQKMQVVLEENYYVFSGLMLDEDGNVKKDEEDNDIELKSLLAEYNQDLEQQEVKDEIFSQQVGEIAGLDINEVSTIVEEEIITPIQENVDDISTTILNQYEVEKEQLSAYNEAIMDYDPLKYIDHEEIQNLTGEMFDNGTEMSKAILETDLQQMEYVANVYEATRDDLYSLQESIVEAKEDSDKAVEEGLLHLQNIKNTNSDENQLILYDFSQKLPYTRLGSLEYTQAYEFMTNPIGMEQANGKMPGLNTADSVRLDSESVDVKPNRQKDYERIAVIICMMICVIIVVTTVRYHFHKQEQSIED